MDLVFTFFFATTVGSPSEGPPAVPPTLLALSGVSAATYVAKETLEKGTGTEIGAVTPRLVVPGRDIFLTVTGTGFSTRGTGTPRNAVSIEDVTVAADRWRDGTVRTCLPPTENAARGLGLPEGSQPLVVTDDQGNRSQPWLVQIAIQS